MNTLNGWIRQIPKIKSIKNVLTLKYWGVFCRLFAKVFMRQGRSMRPCTHPKILLFFTVLLSLNLEAAPLAEKLCDELSGVDNIVNKALSSFNVPGAAVGVVVRDQIVFTRGYGYRNLNKKHPVTERTLFPIASCSKAFTALLLGQLVDEGKIALDDPVKKYIPELCLLDKNVESNLTVRDLIAHRTGMYRHDALWFFSGIQRSQVIPLLGHLEQTHCLRQEYEYNNLMFSVAGIILEKVTGESWEDVIARRVFQPLEMCESNTSIKDLQASKNYSIGYAEIQGVLQEIPFRNASSVNPGAGVNSSISEMSKWLQLQLCDGRLQGKSLIKEESLQEARKTQMPISYSGKENEETYICGCGLGWFVGKYRGLDLISHGGHIEGFSSEVAFLPEKKIGVVILTNSSTDGQSVITVVRNQIFDKLLQDSSTDWIERMTKTRTRNKLGLQKVLCNFEESTKNLSTLEGVSEYIGCYEHPAYGNVELSIQNKQLIFSYNKLTFPIYEKSKDVFVGRVDAILAYGASPVLDITFQRNSAGKIDRMQVPFEAFRGAKPVVFIKKVLNPTP